MTGKTAIILASAVLLISLVAGCAAVEEAHRRDDRAMEELARVRAELAETNARVDELGNKFMLLYEKVEANRESALKGLPVPEAPPAGLKVVSLGPAPGRKSSPRSVKAKKAERKVRPARAKPRAAPEELYNRAQDLFIAGKYTEARAAFVRLARDYPGHGLADNALYWTGEAYYSEQDYTEAAERFKAVVERYPAGNKAPDALLKVGFSYMELGETVDARRTLKELLERYPDSAAARKAEKALSGHSALKKEGAR